MSLCNIILNLRRHGERPCDVAVNWAGSLPAETSIPEAVDLCDRGDWLLWAAEALGLTIPEAAYRPTVLRALREHVPAKLDAMGLAEHAERLRALPDDCCWSSAAAAALAADAAADAADADAAWYAADAATYAATTKAVDAASSAATAAGAWYFDEWSRCADEVRAVLRDDLVRALEEK